MNGAPKVLLCRLFERTSAKGNRYLTGRLSSAKVIAFEARDVPEDQRYGADVVWNVFLQGDEDPQRQPAADRPQYRGDRARRPPTTAEARRAIAQAEPAPIDDTEEMERDFDQRYGGGR